MLMKIAPSLESNFCKRRNRGGHHAEGDEYGRNILGGTGRG